MRPPASLNTAPTRTGRPSQASELNSLLKCIVSFVFYGDDVAISCMPCCGHCGVRCSMQHHAGTICVARSGIVDNNLDKVTLLMLSMRWPHIESRVMWTMLAVDNASIER